MSIKKQQQREIAFAGRDLDLAEQLAVLRETFLDDRFDVGVAEDREIGKMRLPVIQCLLHRREVGFVPIGKNARNRGAGLPSHGHRVD